MWPAQVEPRVSLPATAHAVNGPRITGVFNPGAAVVHAGDGSKSIGILFRMYDAAEGKSYIGLATSRDGSSIDRIAPQPAIAPTLPEEARGVEDARVTYLPDEKQYAITYTGYSDAGACVCLITTPDLLDPSKYTKHGKILEATNKNTVIFPEKVNGKYAMLHRPHPNIALAYADSLTGPWRTEDSHIVLRPQPGTWRSGRVGAGAPPIKTESGWVLPFHGARNVEEGNDYSMGWLVLDLQDPSRVKYVSEHPALAATAPYERFDGPQSEIPQLDLQNFPHGVKVVFPEGLLDMGDKLVVIYGGGDVNTCSAWMPKDGFLNSLRAAVEATPPA